MPETNRMRNGGQILVEALRKNGVDTVYCVPGESYLPVLDALHGQADIRTIVTRHEGAASNMADAYGKLTGRPGICFVTRGPGATHASNGVHTAYEDSTPMILFIGQVEKSFLGRGAFQEVNYEKMFGGLAKWVTQIDRLERIPELVSQAFSLAMSGRPGPVVVALPEDVLFRQGTVADAPAVRISCAAPLQADIEEILLRLKSAKRPIVIVGGTGWTQAALGALADFVRANGLPIAASFRRQDLFDNRDPHYVGQLGLGVSPALAERVRQADLLLVVGTRLAEVSSSGYEIVRSPVPAQAMIHIHPDPEELGKVYQASLPINANAALTALALAKLAPVAGPPWAAWTSEARADFESHAAPPLASHKRHGVDFAQVMAQLDHALPNDAIIANGAGNYTVWVHRFYHYRQHPTQLAPTNGAMGYGLPAAIAAKLQHPDKTVVCFAGDGCFMMYPQELATAIQCNAPIVLILINNGMLGTIRMHQERTFPGRAVATELVNPDFVALAKAFGAYAERVLRTEDFAPAFGRALASAQPSVLELCVDPKQITPQARLP